MEAVEEETMSSALGVVNRDPSFGSSLLSDNFGQRAPADDALDPLKLVANQDSYADRATRTGPMFEKGPKEVCAYSSTLEPLLQNPDGATQKFTDMHGIDSTATSGEDRQFEEPGADDVRLDNTGIRKLAAVTVGTQKLGTTDWGCGTDGGRTVKPEDGVPYGSFAGV